MLRPVAQHIYDTVGLTNQGLVMGVRATDHESHRQFEFRAPVVINTAGPGCRALAASWDRDTPDLFRPSLAWNVLFDVSAPSTHALALTPNYEGARTYFLRPWKGRLLAGTGHAPWSGDPVEPWVSDELMDDFIADINSVLPGADLNTNQIVRVYRGFLPVTREGTVDLSGRETIVDHGKQRGPTGLFSISGVKFTASRRVAARTLATAFPGVRCQAPDQTTCLPTRKGIAASMDWNWQPEERSTRWKNELRQIIDEEAVVHLDDLIMRRTGIGDDPKRARAMANDVAALFGWDNERREREIGRITIEPASGEP